MDAIIRLILNASPLLIYLLVALILLLESSAVPIANTTLLLFTGALASLGHLNIYILAAAAITGSVTGACLAYFLGLKGGRQLLLHLAARLRVDPQKVSIAEGWFRESGVWMTFFSRITPYIRPFACFPCGISRMPFRRFLLAALAGSSIWCVGVLSIGWLVGPRWTLALQLVRTYTLPTVGAFIVLVAICLLGRHAIKRYLRSKFLVTPHPVDSPDQQSTRDMIEV